MSLEESESLLEDGSDESSFRCLQRFSSLYTTFSLLLSLMTMTPTNHMTKVQGPGSLPVHAFCYVLNYPLIESFDSCLVESYLVESQYFQYFCSTFPAQKLL